MEQGAQFKFDPKNKAHVDALKNDDVLVHPGGFMSFIDPSKKLKSTPTRKAVAKESLGERAITPKKKVSMLDKARAAEDEARKRGDLAK